ncbi:MAG: hypothetical protein ABI847_12695, partial [Anaerolineales bacterium]
LHADAVSGWAWALLDTDAILDLLPDRTGFADTAAALWEANKQGRFEGISPPSQGCHPLRVFAG